MTQAKVKHLLCSNLILHAGGRWRMASFCAVQEQLYACFQIVDLGAKGMRLQLGSQGGMQTRHMRVQQLISPVTH